MKKPDTKFFRKYLESMLEHRTTVLSRLGDAYITHAKYILKYYSRNLGKEVFSDLPKKVEKVLIKLVGILPTDACFCFDSVDLNKYSAEKMEGLSKVRDGSTGGIVNGYVINAVSVKGIPILMEREKLEDGDSGKTTRFEIFTHQLEMIRIQFGTGYWILCDRLYDDVRKYNLLIKLGFRFAIRMKKSRLVTILEVESDEKGESEWIGKQIKVGDILPGRYLVTFRGLIEPCSLVIEHLPGLKNPIRVLSDTGNIDSNSDSNIIGCYLKRWEIERVFKSGKQEFDFEKIGTKSAQKIDNLIAMVQLCLGISHYTYNCIESEIRIEETKGKATVTAVAFRKDLKRYLKRVSLNFNRNSIIGFISEYMKKIRKMKWNYEQLLNHEIPLKGA